MKTQFGDLFRVTARGRLNRVHFLAYSFTYTNVALVLLVSLAWVPDAIATPIAVFIHIALFIGIGALAIRRAHDFDETGWFALLLLVPVLNLYVVLMPGTYMTNTYGEVPPRNSQEIVMLAVVMVTLPFLFGAFLLFGMPP